MAAITSETHVANLALSAIGATRINDIDTDTSQEALSCQLHFHTVRNALLRCFQWTFATDTTALSLSSTVPTGGEWLELWPLPPGFIRHIRIIGPGTDPHNPLLHYAIQGRNILTTGQDALTIVYVHNLTPVSQWPDDFIEALRLKLAAAICPDITNDPPKKTELLNEFKALALPAAELADAREVASGENFTPRDLASQSAYVNARYRADGRAAY
jgi:hypothetical protein